MRDQTDLPPAYIKLLIQAHLETQASIRTDCGLTELINLLRGVKQGDVLSALLFCIVLMYVIDRAFMNQNFGLKVGGKQLSNLGYADDLANLAKSIEQMIIMMKRLITCAQEVGLKVNFAKTKIMLIGPLANKTISSISVDNHEIQVVSTFEYLGRKLNNKADDTDEVKSRVSRAWQAFNSHKNMIKSKAISMETKRQIVETYIIPAALYATETIAWTTPLMNKMKVMSNHLMRWMSDTRLSDQVSIERLHEMTHMDDIERTIIFNKLKWFGHLKRSEMPAKMISEGLINGGVRRRGRPSWRWIDDILKWTEKPIRELNRLVTIKPVWRQFCYDVS